MSTGPFIITIRCLIDDSAFRYAMRTLRDKYLFSDPCFLIPVS